MGDRYQPFVARATVRSVLGCEVPVAILEDVVQSKLWDLAAPNRRASERAKDRFDLVRLAEWHFETVLPMLHPELRAVAAADRMRRLEVGDNGWGDDDRSEL